MNYSDAKSKSVGGLLAIIWIAIEVDSRNHEEKEQKDLAFGK